MKEATLQEEEEEEDDEPVAMQQHGQEPEQSQEASPSEGEDEPLGRSPTPDMFDSEYSPDDAPLTFDSPLKNVQPPESAMSPLPYDKNVSRVLKQAGGKRAAPFTSTPTSERVNVGAKKTKFDVQVSNSERVCRS